MRTITFVFEDDTKYLVLPDKPFTDEQLGKLALEAIRKQVVIKYLRIGIPKIIEDIRAEAQSIPWQIVNADSLPERRVFRGALKVENGVFRIDMDKARVIHMDRIRQKRNAKLADLDNLWMKAAATGKSFNGTAAQIEAQRQTLRDIPQTFDLTTAQTPDELENLWPEELI